MKFTKIIRNLSIVVIFVCAICCAAYFVFYKTPEIRENKATVNENESSRKSDSVSENGPEADDELYDTTSIS